MDSSRSQHFLQSWIEIPVFRTDISGHVPETIGLPFATGRRRLRFMYEYQIWMDSGAHIIL